MLFSSKRRLAEINNVSVVWILTQIWLCSDPTASEAYDSASPLWMSNKSKCLNCVSGPLVRDCTRPTQAQYSTSPTQWQPSFLRSQVSPTSLTTVPDRDEHFLKNHFIFNDVYVCGRRERV